jgi:hypothetical protein
MPSTETLLAIESERVEVIRMFHHHAWLWFGVMIAMMLLMML